MPYTKHNFQSGGDIKASDFNELENQVAQNETENITLRDMVATSATVSDGVATFKNSKGQALFTMNVPTGSGTVSGMTESQVKSLINTYNFATKSELPASWTENQIRNLITGYGYGTYTKPSDGIPESDLAQGVRDKLNRDQSVGGITEGARIILINILRNAMYTDEQNDNISLLDELLQDTEISNDEIIGISVVTEKNEYPVGTNASSIGIVVTAFMKDGSSSIVKGYKVTGTVVEGTNVFYVFYNGKSASFTVTGVSGEYEYYDCLIKQGGPGAAINIPVYAYNYNNSIKTEFAHIDTVRGDYILGVTRSYGNTKMAYLGYDPQTGEVKYVITDTSNTLSGAFVDLSGNKNTLEFIPSDSSASPHTFVVNSDRFEAPYISIPTGKFNGIMGLMGEQAEYPVYSGIKMGRTQIRNTSGDLVYEFVPAKKSATGMFGFHDTINDIFYAIDENKQEYISGGRW